ncbi:chaperone LolA [Natronocella acetinitrilica]|uniref:Outer-membrane lipoprotein carrier protein n=1 Tax=Natronocella acetinitrilica TaxID=414046 RepID=A0AAE3G598_9GAMM|nr:outer membrane lipoprotein chaperone LolA [Natronocella acetinitrilica]MCP1676111.1 chaperone LolA [Natronocella acetinitrilica]
MVHIPRLILFFALLLAPLALYAGKAELERYYADVKTLEGRFVQETADEDGRVLERSEGHMRIARPNRFNWQYETPYEQQIVADGERVWVYDVDLLQVSVRPLEDVLGSGPALLLSGELDALEEQFRISEDNGWLLLEPRSRGWEIEEARLRFEDGVPVEVVIMDGLGQKNTLRLSELRVNDEIAPEHFQFEPPPEADVLGEDEEW